ncbi:MAG: DUF308 domain-containing protein [Candidatus Hodarchaeota archaeon]
MSKRSVEKGLNASNIAYGLVIMIIAVTIFFYSGAAILTLILLYSVILILSGMARIVNAFSNEELSNSGAIVKFISGILLIIISIFVILAILIEPTFSVALVVLIYSIALLIVGIARIVIGLTSAKYMKWFRIFLFIIGIVIAILSLLILFIPTLETSMIFLMFAIAIFLSGFARFLLGFTGKEKYKK